jgi:hypothetical protein
MVGHWDIRDMSQGSELIAANVFAGAFFVWAPLHSIRGGWDMVGHVSQVSQVSPVSQPIRALEADFRGVPLLLSICYQTDRIAR